MGLSYCYIDYSKQNKKPLKIDMGQTYQEITLSCTHADLYFSAPLEDASITLLEDARFVLLIDGALESPNMTPEKVLELLKELEIQDILDQVEGVFSLTLYDKLHEKFYVTRDHFGVCQSFYYQKDDFVLFSNTLKTFKRSTLFEKEINFDTLGQYLQYSYIFQPNTMFQNCYKVKPAHVIAFDLKEKSVVQKKYWDILDFYNMPKVKMGEDEIIDRSETLLKNAIKAKIGTSQKVGTFLSGGYDSSTIVSLLHTNKRIGLESFTVGFDDEALDEAPFAEKIAEHLEVKYSEYYFSAEHLESLLNRFAEVYDEPIADMAALPTMLITEKSTQKIEILFGGEGGDEIFASSGFLERLEMFSKIAYPMRLCTSYALKPFGMRTRYEKFSKMLKEKDIENIWKYKDMTLSFGIVKKLINAPIKEREMRVSTSTKKSAPNLLDRLFPLMFKSYVSDNLLTKFSYAAKAGDIEPKVPYLDRRFVEFLATVDVDIKQKNGTNKYILNQILQKYLPSKLIERPKKGFSVPVGEILKTESRALLDRYINEARLEKEGIFNPEEVMDLKERFLNSNSHYDEQNIWNILIFQIWYEHWFSE